MKDLFPEFETTDTAGWKERIIRDLKGEPFESLIWHNNNGFDIQPFYTREHLNTAYQPAFQHSEWEICAMSTQKNSKSVNRELLQQLETGATAISVDLSGAHIDTLLQGIQADYISSTFTCGQEQLKEVETYFSSYTEGSKKISLFPANISNRNEMASWLKKTSALEKNGARVIGIDGRQWTRKGALPYYEIALIFSSLAEWLEVAEKENRMPSTAISVRTEVDTDFFIQIAKLRALRRLWEIIRKEFKLSNELYIIAETSLTNKSVSGRHNNLLRTTIESTAAVAGGCNELVVNVFDHFSANKSNAGKRLALNQQLILKEESHLDKMADMACGSYYIESLTDALAARALESMKEITSGGGISNAPQKNIIADELDKQYKQKEQRLLNNEDIVVGLNRFRDQTESPANIEESLNESKRSGIRNAVLAYESLHNLKKA